jgi:hypothetical protein
MSEHFPSEGKGREQFALKLFRSNSPQTPIKIFNRLLIPEIFALTLLTNRAVLRLLAYLNQYIQGGFGLPPTGQDSWINSWIDPKLKRQCFKVSAARRSLWRKEALGYDRKPNVEIKTGYGKGLLAEHVSVRAYPICFQSPQKHDDSMTKRVLLVAYHLERHWLYFQIEAMRYPWEQKSFGDIKIADDLLSKDQWSDFLDQIANISLAEGALAPLCLHVPDGSELRVALDRDHLLVIDDMPPEGLSGDRFNLQVFRRKTASLRNLYVDLAEALKRKPRE